MKVGALNFEETWDHNVVIICNTRRDYITFCESLIALSELEKRAKGIITSYGADPDHNHIINRKRYIHGESIQDFGKLPVLAFILVEGWEQNPRAESLYNAARKKARIYGHIVKAPLQLQDPRKFIV